MKLRRDELQYLLRDARHSTPIGSVWAHYKGGTYQVTGYGLDTERGDLNIEYRRIAGPNFDARQEHPIRYHRPIEHFVAPKFKEISA